MVIRRAADLTVQSSFEEPINTVSPQPHITDTHGILQRIAKHFEHPEVCLFIPWGSEESYTGTEKETRLHWFPMIDFKLFYNTVLR